ncbi:hypothetical protein GQR58_002619 [Nymphon striatum]|nr:hypothetical protein GQR58_002619 [Nymphon striatum]
MMGDRNVMSVFGYIGLDWVTMMWPMNLVLMEKQFPLILMNHQLVVWTGCWECRRAGMGIDLYDWEWNCTSMESSVLFNICVWYRGASYCTVVRLLPADAMGCVDTSAYVLSALVVVVPPKNGSYYAMFSFRY